MSELRFQGKEERQFWESAFRRFIEAGSDSLTATHSADKAVTARRERMGNSPAIPDSSPDTGIRIPTDEEVREILKPEPTATEKLRRVLEMWRDWHGTSGLNAAKMTEKWGNNWHSDVYRQHHDALPDLLTAALSEARDEGRREAAAKANSARIDGMQEVLDLIAAQLGIPPRQKCRRRAFSEAP